MHIGIDARFLSHPQPGGFKTYSTEFISALLRVDSDTHYTLYIDRPMESPPSGDNVSLRVLSKGLPGLGTILREQYSLARAAKRDSIDLMHFLANTACLSLPCPFVLSLHDTIQLEGNIWESHRPPVEQLRRWIMTSYAKWCIRKAARKASMVIADCAYGRDRILQHLSLPQEKVVSILLGPGAKHPAREDFPVEEILSGMKLAPGYVLAVTGVDRRKNAEAVIEAYDALDAQSIEQHPLVLVAPRRSQIDEWLTIPAHARVIQKPSTNGMNALFAGAAAFVFPSFDEGFGLPPLEAMAMGAPVIASDIPPHRETMEGAALFVDPRDITTLTATIQRVLTEKGLAETMRDQGAAKLAEIPWERTARGTVEIYRRALQETN